MSPSYIFWIGRFSQQNAIVFNTEYRKKSISRQSSSQFITNQQEESNESDHKLTEEDLVEMMDFSSV